LRDRLTYWAWKLRGKHLVRLHLDRNEPTVEGILVGTGKNGHYLVLAPKLLPDNQPPRDLAGTLRVPRERVVYVQEL